MAKKTATKKKPTVKKRPRASTAMISKVTTPEAMIVQAINKGASVDTLERLLVIRKEVKAEQALEAFNLALSNFQAQCPIIKKTKKVQNKEDKGGGTRYSYAPLDSIVKQVRPILSKNRLSYTVDAEVEKEWVTATCKITHEMGHSEKSSFKIPVDLKAYMSQPQKFASALTFAKRYAFCNALGILTGDEDNDAQETQKPKGKESESEKVKPEEALKRGLEAIKEENDKEILTAMKNKIAAGSLPQEVKFPLIEAANKKLGIEEGKQVK